MMQISTITAAATLLAIAGQGQSTSSPSFTTSAAFAGSSSTFMPIFDPQNTILPSTPLAGSIVGADATATTIAIACYNSTDCGIGSQGLTLTQGPSTFIGDITTVTADNDFTATLTVALGCDITATTQAATCLITGTETIVSGDQTVVTTITTSSAFASTDISYSQLLITAGLDKLNSSKTTTTPAPSGSASAKTSSTSAGSASAKATQTSKGAAGAVVAPLPTGKIGVGFGGLAAAAVVAIAGIL